MNFQPHFWRSRKSFTVIMFGRRISRKLIKRPLGIGDGVGSPQLTTVASPTPPPTLTVSKPMAATAHGTPTMKKTAGSHPSPTSPAEPWASPIPTLAVHGVSQPSNRRGAIISLHTPTTPPPVTCSPQPSPALPQGESISLPQSSTNISEVGDGVGSPQLTKRCWFVRITLWHGN